MPAHRYTRPRWLNRENVATIRALLRIGVTRRRLEQHTEYTDSTWRRWSDRVVDTYLDEVALKRVVENLDRSAYDRLTILEVVEAHHRLWLRVAAGEISVKGTAAALGKDETGFRKRLRKDSEIWSGRLL
jgi:hypothetical protein